MIHHSFIDKSEERKRRERLIENVLHAAVTYSKNYHNNVHAKFGVGEDENQILNNAPKAEKCDLVVCGASTSFR